MADPQHDKLAANDDASIPSVATVLLRRIEDGDLVAADELLPLVYDQLRAIAGSLFRSESAGHTLQPTALVHEAYIKLVKGAPDGLKNRAHFCAVAAIAMRQVLRDHARASRSAKRGGGRRREPLADVTSASLTTPIDALVLDEALEQLAEADDRAARVFEMRFFGGLTHDEVAGLLDTSVPTVERAWRRARAWIASAIADEGG